MKNIEANYVVVNTMKNVYEGLRQNNPEYQVIGDYHATVSDLNSAIDKAADYYYLDLVKEELKIYALVPIEMTEDIIRSYQQRLLQRHSYLAELQAEKLHKRQVHVSA